MDVIPLPSDKSFFSFVYDASDKKGREDLFTQLESIKNHIVDPCLLMGDFNYIANINERIGHRPRSSELDMLRRCKKTCEIHDVKNTGRFFTWTNKKEGTVRVLRKIGRVMETTFPTAEAIFFSEGDFDRTPMLVHFFKQHRRTQPFKFFDH